MSKFILIENPGIAAPESFTLLGASNKAGTDAIGQFGSGTKFGVLTCLRKRLDPVVYCGNLKLAFGVRNTTFDGKEQGQISVKYTGKTEDNKQVNRTALLSFVLRYGEIDWKDDVTLALREFVSNALDAVSGDASRIIVSIVEGEPRAKAGTTRVYVPLTDDGENFVNNIGDWFLHFSKGKNPNVSGVIEKNGLSRAKIYRRGVLVRKVEGADSLFDYNLNDLPLDEARVASDWTVQRFAAKALNAVANPEIFVKILTAPKSVWESTFDLSGKYDYTTPDNVKAKNADAWRAAQEHVLDDKTIFAGEHEDTSFAEGKGYKVIKLNNERYEAILAKGLRTVNAVLTIDEREGRQIDRDTSPAAVKAVKHVWDILVNIDATKGEKYPLIRSYTEHNTGNGNTLGLWKPIDGGTVYINNCLLSGDEISPELFAVCIEELAHHITKATDNSRGFQEFFIQTLTKVIR